VRPPYLCALNEHSGKYCTTRWPACPLRTRDVGTARAVVALGPAQASRSAPADKAGRRIREAPAGLDKGIVSTARQAQCRHSYPTSAASQHPQARRVDKSPHMLYKMSAKRVFGPFRFFYSYAQWPCSRGLTFHGFCGILLVYLRYPFGTLHHKHWRVPAVSVRRGGSEVGLVSRVIAEEFNQPRYCLSCAARSSNV